MRAARASRGRGQTCVLCLSFALIRITSTTPSRWRCHMWLLCTFNTFNCVLNTRGAENLHVSAHGQEDERWTIRGSAFQGTIRFKQPRARARASTAAGPHIFSSCGPESSEKTLSRWSSPLHFGATRERILSEIFLLGSCDHTLTENFQPQSKGVT